MSKSYDEGYTDGNGDEWTCTTDSAAQTHSDYSVTEKLSTFGGPEALIKSDLTVEQLNSPDFNVRFRVTAGAEGAAVRVDSVKVRAYYRRPVSNQPVDARRPTSLASVAENAGRLCIVGAGGRVITSDDAGATWTERTSNTGFDLWDVVAVTGGFAAVGDNGTVITSSDGITWIVQNTGTDTPLRAIGRNGLDTLIVGKSGGTFNSRNRVSWRPV